MALEEAHTRSTAEFSIPFQVWPEAWRSQEYRLFSPGLTFLPLKAESRGGVTLFSIDVPAVPLRDDPSSPFSYDFLRRVIEAVDRLIARRISEALSAAAAVSDNGPGTLERIFAEIDDLCAQQEAPSADACAEARTFLAEVNRISPIPCDASVIEASDGDLLIHWDAAAKSLVLIFSAGGGAPSLYRESLSGVHPVDSNLHRNVDARELSEALEWVQSPTR